MNVQVLRRRSLWRSALISWRAAASHLLCKVLRREAPNTSATATRTDAVVAGIASTGTHGPNRPARVDRVDDPFGQMSLVTVCGNVGTITVDCLTGLLADLGHGHYVHLDLGSASIRSGQAMRSLEAIADDLETRGVVLRVVGLDPLHPMLTETL